VNNVLRIILPLYLIAYFAVAFLWRSVAVWRRTGINPYVLGRTDSAYDYIGLVFRLTFALLAAAIILFSFSPRGYEFLLPIRWLEHVAARWIGVVLLSTSMIWTVIAQAQMGASWRIGIDQTNRTELVHRGLFSISRNPIFLGMRITLLGIFLVIPNAITLLTLVLGDVLMQIQVRLEEEHLGGLHGADYDQYRRRVRRWI
jgi:protein-S-isoprenylcysteine O-methyltransferase Ste14